LASIIQTCVWCGTLLIVAFLILLSLPKSMLRCVLVEIGGWTLSALAAIYVFNPIDLIPDFIPVAGWLDDGGALIGGLAAALAAWSARGDRKLLQQK